MSLSCKQEIGIANSLRAWRKVFACRHVFFPHLNHFGILLFYAWWRGWLGGMVEDSFFHLEDGTCNPLTKITVFRKPPLVYMAVTIDARTLVFDFLVANHNKLTRREVTTTVCRKVDWRIFSAYPLKGTVVFFSRNGRFLTNWRVLMCTNVS